MKILVTTNFYFEDSPTGVARLASDLAHALVRSGHEVWFLSQSTKKDSPPYVQKNGLHLLRYYIEPSNFISIRRDTKHISKVKLLLKNYLPIPPDIIHGHDLLIYLAALEFYQGRGHLCYSIHSPAIEELPIVWRSQGFRGRLKLMFGLGIIRKFEGKVLASSAMLSSESKFTADLIRQHYGNQIASRIKVIPGWLDLNHFCLRENTLAIRQQLGWPLDKPVIFVLRRHEARMGLENFLNVMHKVYQSGIVFHAIIGGIGSLTKDLKALCGRLNLQTCVSFIGRVPDNILPLAYSACDVSVMPTEHLEGFGIPLLESMACGRPVLGIPIGAIPEIISSFESQWIARGATPDDLANLVMAFLNNRLPYHSPEQIRKYVSERYPSEIAYLRYAKWLGIEPIISKICLSNSS